MNPKIKLLDSAKKMCNPQTDMALAARIGVSRSAVSMWRKGGSITEEHLTALASIAETDGEVVARVLKDQAKTEAQKRVWGQLLDRLSAAAAVVALLVVAVHPGAHETLLVALSPVAITPTFYTLCEVALLTLLCIAATYHCWSLHRKRTGQ
ncbi:DUF3693 domain-containing protein [Xanthomonas euvesicatoria]|uniref:DUF3693 domain-containing protein n=1 Tax=Xanthomonas euvesicatoria TaxID=456327 RepID=UPI00080F549A|nr:DUF3693 domain-containing protein [Xanthomonas euvesicatoria]